MRASKLLARAGAGLVRRIIGGCFVAALGLFTATAAMAALDVSMSIAPTYANPIFPGDVTAYRITLTNSNSSGAVTGVAFTNTLPNVFATGIVTVAGGGAVSYTCFNPNTNATTAGVGTLTANVGAGTISLSGASVPAAFPSGASGRCDITVEVTSITPGKAPNNIIGVGGVTGTDPTVGAIANGTQAAQSITVNTLNSATLNKNFSSTTVLRNDQTVRLTIVIGNPNATRNLPLNTGTGTPAFGVRDVLPAGLQVAPTPNATSVCSGAGVAPTFAPAAGLTTLVTSGGTVAANGTCTIAVDLVATSTGGGSSANLNNTISGTADFGNTRGLAANNTSAMLTVNSVVQVTTAFNPTTVGAGQTATLTTTITNASPTSTMTLASAFVDDIDQYADSSLAGRGLIVIGTPTLSAGCTGAAAVSNTDAGQSYTLAAGTTIAPGASCAITISYQGALTTDGVPETFTNTIAQGAVSLTDAGVISPLAASTVTVVDQLTVSKTALPTDTAAPGAPVRFQINVRNFSGSALSTVRITDVLPTGMTLLPTSPSAPSLTGAGCVGLTFNEVISLGVSTVTFRIGTVPAGVAPNAGSCNVLFYAMTPPGAVIGTTLSNTIAAGGVVSNDGGAGAISNNGGSSPTSADLVLANSISVGKGFTPAAAFEGTVSTLTITFTNITANPVTNLNFTDPLPLGSTGQQLIVATPANASTTCAGGVVTAAPGASSVILTGGVIPARAANGSGANGTCTLTVSVIGAAGAYTNTLAPGALTGTETYGNGTTNTAASPGPVTATLTYNSALTAAKGFSPGTVASGGMSTVTITLGNTGTGTLNNVSVIDPLPAGMVVATPNGAYTTCGGAPVITATAGAGTAAMSGAVIPASGQCNFIFNVTATGGANWVNTIPIGNVTAAGGVRNISAITATLLNSTLGGVNVTNNTSPNSLTAPGQTSVLTITLTNNGSIALTGIALSDYFTTTGQPGGPLTGMVLASDPAAATTCTGGVASATAGGTQVSLAGGSLLAGASCTITANVTLTTVGTVQNVIPVSAITTNQGITNTLPTTTSLSVGSNIGVTKRFTPMVIKPGDRSRLQITFINPVNLPLTNLTSTDNLPAGVVVAPSPNPTTTCVGATVAAPLATQVTLTGGSLPAAASGVSGICVAEIDVTAAAVGTYNNVIAAGQVSGTIGGGPVMNPEPAPATLQVRIPVTIGKTFNPTTVGLGVPTLVTITLTNANAIVLTGAVLNDPLPTNLTVALVPNAATTCAGGVVTAAPSATSVLLTGATIPAGGACTVTFNALSNVSGIYVNTIPAGGLSTSQGVTNEDPATDTVRVLNPPTVSKQFSPTSIPANGTSTLTIVLGNTNASDATLTSALIDTLPTSPAPIVVANPTGIGGTCPGTKTAAVGGPTVTYANGSIIPPGGCTIIVNVTGATQGVYTNTIPVGGLQTTLGNNVQPTNADLTISPLGFISGKVFRDNNVTPNGTFEIAAVAPLIADAPIASVTVDLTGTDYGADGVAGGVDDTVVNRTTTTDALGNYSFTALNPGSYTVSEPNQPAGTINGITTAGAVTLGGGGTIGAATGVGVTPSVISNIILLKNVGNTVAVSQGNNFAEVATSSIAGQVYLDQNDNGVKNAADTAIAGVTIELLNGASVVVATTTTNASGGYSFTGLAPGTYSVREPTQPAGTANGKTLAGTVANGGTPGTPTAQGVVPSLIASLILPPATASTGNDFAEVPAGRQIGGRVFTDANNDGLFNGTDGPLAGVTINLTGTDFNGFPVAASTTTTGDGRYVFTGLAAGTYSVTEPTQPPSTANGMTVAGTTGGLATLVGVTPSAITGIDLNALNTVSANNDFAEITVAPPAGGGGGLSNSVAGVVYIDLNTNGRYDVGEPGIPGVPVRITGPDTNGGEIERTTATNSDGAYMFIGLPVSGSGGYIIHETQPSYIDAATTVATGNSGTPISAKPVAAGAEDRINGVQVTASSNTRDYNFGERASGAISGFVYDDANDNGVFDAGERPIPGVSILLTGADIRGASINRTMATDANGAYLFADLIPSNLAGYTVIETQPTGYVDGKTTILAGNPGRSVSDKPTFNPMGDVIVGIVLSTQGTLTNYNFGEIAPAATVSGYVYVDANGNGVRDAVELPIPETVVNLTGADSGGVAVARTQVTGLDGAFSFRVPPSNAAGYALTEVQPAGFTDGRTTVAAGNPGAVVSVKPVGVGDGDRITGVIVAANQNYPNYAYGEVAIPLLKPPIVNGYVYLDRKHNRVRPTDGSLEGQANWDVMLRQNGRVICTTRTDARGFYQFDNLHCPGYEVSGLPIGSGFSITFSKDGNNLPAVPTSGGDRGTVPPTGGEILNITLSASDRVVEQNLPLDPAGVVYDSVTRQPIPGATVVIGGPAGFIPGVHLVGGTQAQTQVVGTDGLYQFLLQNGFPTGIYTLTVTAPAGYMPAPSTSLPACANTLTVGLIPNPALIQASDFAPGLSVTPQLNPNACPGLIAGGSSTTQYYFRFLITNGGSAPILNNHIPLDPFPTGGLQITKTTPMIRASRGGLVPYTITASNPLAVTLNNIRIRDQLPPGFKYREGSATRDGVTVAPTVEGGYVTWPQETYAARQIKTYGLILTVGAGVSPGDFINHAWIVSQTGMVLSNVAAATVRIVPDPTFDCSDVLGKVFDDRNANGVQDEPSDGVPGEPGLPGVRLATVNGLLVTTDADGRYHVTCPMIPREDRGSNFILKLDTRTLPTGYRVVTGNPETVRLTSGKFVKLNFGASLHRVVRLDVTSQAFADDKVDEAFAPKVAELITLLREKPSVLRIAYHRTGEDADLAKRRVGALRALIEQGWRRHADDQDGKRSRDQYRLIIEEEADAPAQDRATEAQAKGAGR